MLASLIANIGSGRWKGQRVGRALGGGQSAAESPSGGATGPAPAPCAPREIGDNSAAGQSLTTSLPLQRTAPSEGPTSSAGPGARGGASLGSSGVKRDKYLSNECCLSPLGSAVSPAPAPNTPMPPAHSLSGQASLEGVGGQALGPSGSGLIPGVLVASCSVGPWERPAAFPMNWTLSHLICELDIVLSTFLEDK